MTMMDTLHINRTPKLSGNESEQFSLGVTKINEKEVRISAWQQKENNCQLCLYRDGKVYKKLPMTALTALGMEDIFSVTLTADNIAQTLRQMEYDFIVSGEHCMDPYARLVCGRNGFGKKHKKIRAGFVFDDFDWTGENRKRLEISEMIWYQVHVRNFTKHKSSGVKNPGTFDGLREKIPYLCELGINTLFLLPVYEFDEWMKDDNGGELAKINCWGYGTEAYYFAPKSGFSSTADAGTELKKLVKCLHQNGMNLILDFYFTDRTPAYILQCLRYYVLHYHIDGFRINQECVDISWLQEDPVLSHAVIVGNSWDGNAIKHQNKRILEMNDGFLVDARRFLKSDEGLVKTFYHRFMEQGNGAGTVHYICSHNGFTLRDMISYDVKHNEANGERNMDGTEYNYSWNCGFEGATRRKAVLSMRRKQERNAFVMVLLGMAVPMLLAGDEFGRSQKGNNNAYCLDNTTTWLDWTLLEKNRETYQFVQELIQFRKQSALYHQNRKLCGMDPNGDGAPDISCHGREPWVVDFSYYSRELGILFGGTYYGGKSLYFAFNFHWDGHDFYLPDIKGNKAWKILFDTAEAGVKEIENGIYHVKPRSIVIFEEKTVQKKRMPKKNRHPK